MQVTKETQREGGFGVGGVDDLSFPICFFAGHVCSENEAGALVQLSKENIRNNLREKIKELVTAGGDKAAAQSLLDEYAAQYEFNKAGGGGGRTSDPVMAEALDNCRKLVRKALVKKGVKLSSVSAADINSRAKKLIERRPELLKKAAKVVADREKDLDNVLSETELSE